VAPYASRVTDDAIRDLFAQRGDPIIGWDGSRMMTQATLEGEDADLAAVSAWVEKVGGQAEPTHDHGVRYIVPPEAFAAS
jgi:hypothetical protein